MKRNLAVTAEIDAPADDAMEALAAEPWAVVTGQPRPSGDVAAIGRISLDLGAGTNLSHRVTLELDEPRRSPAGGVSCHLRWQPVSHSSVVPTFDGDLELGGTGSATGSPASLTLHGWYRPPLGVVGAVGDGMVGQRLARRMVAGYAEVVARRIESAAARLRAARVVQPEPPGPPPELFVG
jgi:hypothetical protein